MGYRVQREDINVPVVSGVGCAGGCPRFDAWYPGKGWVTVGRALILCRGIERRGARVLKLARAARRFRLVEDEPEVSTVDWIRGDGEDWGVGVVVTSPAELHRFGDMNTRGLWVVEWEFSVAVRRLESCGYYDVVR